ncbi:hypothetical protein J8TS2_28830 [Lederbergia ruris]|uniref:Uncharacterized protein n=1 Tax=Lederbergia ruris TaxID=217495 RepID=A0ABQ4KKU1_9BACI|nr:hypothetical protein J8TS2_28830 [Lederbergia ruris]
MWQKLVLKTRWNKVLIPSNILNNMTLFKEKTEGLKYNFGFKGRYLKKYVDIYLTKDENEINYTDISLALESGYTFWGYI